MSVRSKRVNIDRFLESIDKMLASKYILIDRRISDILQAIAETPDVYNLIAECMINFDFKYEWKKATISTIIKYPSNIQKKIAFIFCLLSNIDDRNLDITKLLDTYFSYDPMHSPYDVFCKTVIEEFKNLITNCIKNENEKIQLEDRRVSEIHQMTISDFSKYDDNYRLLMYKLGELSKLVSSMKKFKGKVPKETYLKMLSEFSTAVSEKHSEYFFTFITAISDAAKNVKPLKSRLIELEIIVNEIIGG